MTIDGILGVGEVVLVGESELFEIVRADRLVRPAFGLGKGWQQQRRQNRDDSNHDQ